MGVDNEVAVIIPATFTPSASTVPSKNAFLHSFDVAPISYRLSVVGTKFEANSPPTTTSSVSPSPVSYTHLRAHET